MMKTQRFKPAQRLLHNGGGCYGRQWLCKSSRELRTAAYPARIFWPVYL